MTERPQRARVAATYDDAATGYDAHDAGKRGRFATIERSLRALCRSGDRVLEIGCGTGRLLAQVTATTRVGVDISQRMLEASPHRNLHLCRADAHQLPFADGAFDVVLAGNASFRYLDYPRAFAECARVLAPRGRLGVHQYAARTRTLRNPLARPGNPLHLDSIEQLTSPARAHFDVKSVARFRPVRFAPYAVAVPPWLPGHLWAHCCVTFEKRA